ncbi:MAG TPA: hypothetical protein VH278_11775, partial [Burkholderiaceae bacterium]|nr:hypothetical protein [Burkholderiaceae bacterium]
MAALSPLRALLARPLGCLLGRRLSGSIALVASLLMGSDLAAQQVQVDSPADAITEGRLSLELRPRYTDIWDAGLNQRGHAWTMRSIVGWQTATFDDVRVVVEGIHTDVVDAHNLSVGSSQYYV